MDTKKSYLQSECDFFAEDIFLPKLFTKAFFCDRIELIPIVTVGFGTKLKGEGIMKKKFLCIVLIVLIFANVLVSCDLVEDFRSMVWSSDAIGLTFSLKSDGTYLVEIGEAKYLSTITIPSTYNDVPVTEVGQFNNTDAINMTLKSVIISEGITTISARAFYNCANLMSVTIPSSVTSIGEDAFYGCNAPLYTKENGATYVGDRNNPYAALIKVDSENLGDYTFPDKTTTIADGVFKECTGLTSITIPNSITKISKDMFYGCSNLKQVTLSNSVTSIEDSAFMGCTSLKSIVIPDSVFTVGNSAFANCKNLTSVTFGKSVKLIGKTAFGGCSNLSSATFTKYDGWVYSSKAYPISSDIISDPTEAARCLTSVYPYKSSFWYCE